MENHVQVAVRVRPLSEKERENNRATVVQCKTQQNEIAVMKRRTYAFDKVYGQYSTQKDVFRSTVKPVIDEALRGYNCTMFAYGQTGTGKTYTMLGDLAADHEASGIIPRCVRYIFDTLQSSQQEYSVKVSFLQLYNEELKDLLAPDSNKKLRLMEDVKRGGIYCQNLLEVTTQTAGHVFQLLESGVKNRTTAETLLNECSSRSHSIFTLRIHSKESNPAGEDLLKIGQLNLVDLAGSECVGRSGARFARAREAGNINQSLLTLGRVITALVDNHPHVPYRDSKLTRLLQESLGGKAKTTIIATLAPCADCIEETLSTLDYAHRAKSIKNKPEVNQKMTKNALLKEYGEEIESLRSALSAQRQKDGIYLPPAQFTEMQERLAGQSAQLSELEDELDRKNLQLKENEEEFAMKNHEIDELSQAKNILEQELGETQAKLSATEAKLEDTVATLKKTQQTLAMYRKHEEELVQHGSKATKLFNESQCNNELLLHKIDRHERVALGNYQSQTRFVGDITQEFSQFDETFQRHQQQQLAVVRDTIQDIESSHDVNEKELSHLSELVDNMKQVVHEFIKVMESEAMDQWQQSQTHKTKCLSWQQARHEGFIQSLEKLATFEADFSSQMKQQLFALKQQSAEMCEQVKCSLGEALERTNQFCEFHNERLVVLKQCMQNQIKKHTTELATREVNWKTELEQAHAVSLQDMDLMKQQLLELMAKCISTQVEQHEQRKQRIHEDTEATQQRLSKMQRKLEDEITETRINSELKKTATTKALNGADDHVQTLRESLAAECNARHADVEADEEQLGQWIDGTRQEAVVQHKALEQEILREFASQQEIKVKEKAQLRDCFEHSVDETLTQLSSQQVQLKKHADDTLKESRTQLERTSQLTRDGLQQVEQHLSTSTKRVESLAQERQSVDILGSTPKKPVQKTFPVFARLDVATLPHLPAQEAPQEVHDGGQKEQEANDGDRDQVLEMADAQDRDNQENHDVQASTNGIELQRSVSEGSGLKRSRSTRSTSGSSAIVPPKRYRLSPPLAAPLADATNHQASAK